jgi:cullin-associated NEDD8-dissociated protein 1
MVSLNTLHIRGQCTHSFPSIGPLAARIPGETIAPLIDKLTDLTNKDIDISIPNTALRSLIAALPQPKPNEGPSTEAKDAYTAVSKVLIPRLVGHVVLPSNKPPPHLPTGLLESQKDKGYSSDAVDVMIEIVKCYGSLLQDLELVALAKAVMNIIESPQAGGVVKKRALAGIGALLPHFNDTQVRSFVAALTESYQNSQLSIEHRRFLVATIGTLARSSPTRFGPYVDDVIPYVLEVLSQEEMSANASIDEDVEVDPEIEELRETALIALEAMLGSCPNETKPHLASAIDAALRYLKYDPNVADVEDDDMGDVHDDDSDDGITDDAPDDDDDEYAELDDEDAFSDVDDMSWKVRRCAAKALYTIVSGSSPNDGGLLFGKIAPVLMSRLFKEREDSVRLEVIAATTALIRKTGSGLTEVALTRVDSSENPAMPTNTRKRRRQDSEADKKDPDLRGLISIRSSPPILPASPPSGSQAELVSLVPKIVQALTKLWKKASISLKQAAVGMLKTLTLARNGILSDNLQLLEDAIADALKPASGAGTGSAASGTSATVASLQIETLMLISVIAETNGTSVLIPFVIALIPSVTAIARDRNYKVSTEALGTVEQFVKALTPPRLQSANQDHSMHIEKLWQAIVDRVTDNNTDLEVRHRAIQVFGVLIARTSGTKLLSPSTRVKSLGVLSDRLKNETTRLASARAIGLIGEAATSHDNIGSAWVREVSLEMANQLRKADRSLRGSCLESLQYLALNPVTSSLYETDTIVQIQTLLMPLISVTDLHLLTPALVIMSKIIPTNAQALVTPEVVDALCGISHTRIEGPPLRAYLLVAKVIGEHGVGAPLMKGLLTVGTDGETMVLGRAIGTLLVYGGDNLTITVNDFLKELETSQDLPAICLALTVLGEVGFRMGPLSPVKVQTFINCLSAESDKIRLAAAVALGSASSNNISECLPIILRSLTQTPGADYLYLHSLKEILEHSESSLGELQPYAAELWQKLFAVSQAEDNSAVGAECIGRLATIDPNTYVPELSKWLSDPNASVRGTVISAFRFTLGETGSAYNSILINAMTPMLQTMLQDKDLSNRRLAVTTLNAAIHNKPELVIPDVGQLLPTVLDDSKIKPELIKQVKIGPFTHTEDAGLDLRKSAYATMYALLDCPGAIPHLPIAKIFDRIQDGIPDDHDIRTLCILMLTRLSVIDPDETRRRLSPLAEKFRIVLGAKLKDNAVKQEIEKVNEANAAVIRITIELDRKFPGASAEGAGGELIAWKGYLEYLKKEFSSVARQVQMDA